MRIPQQVTERVKEAPAQALRAVFSGIGQVLLVADRIKSRAAEPGKPQPATTAPQAQAGPGPAAAVKDETRWRSLDETGNVRLLSDEDAGEPEPGAGAAEAVPAAANVPATGVAPAAAETPAEPAVPEPPPAGAVSAGDDRIPGAASQAAKAAPARLALPVPNYDELSVASLRARLRGLDAAQVRVLLDYEKAHAGRDAIRTMFERRIAKLETGGA